MASSITPSQRHIPSSISLPSPKVQEDSHSPTVKDKVSFLYTVFKKSWRDAHAIKEPPKTFSEQGRRKISQVTFEKDPLAPGKEVRTRTDFIAYAAQFHSAALLAGTTLFEDIEKRLLKKLPSSSTPEMHDALHDAAKDFCTAMISKIKTLPLNPSLIGIEEKELEATASEQLPEYIAQKLHSKIMYSGALEGYFSQAKQEILSFAEQNWTLFQEILTTKVLRKQSENTTSTNRIFPLSERWIQSLLSELHPRFIQEIDLERARIILAEPGWKGIHEFAIHLHNRAGEQKKFIVQHQFVGRTPYSSSFPRNRRPDQNPSLPNFFKTIFTESPFSFLNNAVTRSALPLEFLQKNTSLRQKSTLLQLQELALVHAKLAVERSGPLQADLQGEGTKESPIRVPFLFMTLLTPSLERDWKEFLGKIPGHFFGKPAKVDNERRFINELNALCRTLQRNPLVFEIDGRFVQVDITHLNIPINEQFETAYKSEKTRFTVAHKGCDEGVLSTVEQLTQRARQRRSDIIKTLPMDAQQLLNEKNTAREKLSETIFSKGKPPSDVERDAWVDTSFAFLEKLKNTKEEERETILYLSILDDLCHDVEELAKTNLYKQFDSMYGNRASFASRLLMLSGLLSYGRHFCCRSGKDRTGVVGQDLTLLLSETSMAHRLPSWFDQHIQPHHWDNRADIATKDGSCDFFVKTNFGRIAWWNLTHCPYHMPTPRNEEEKRSMDRFQNAIAELMAAHNRHILLKHLMKLPVY